MKASIGSKAFEYHRLGGRKNALGFLLTHKGHAYVILRDPSLDRAPDRLKGPTVGDNGIATKRKTGARLNGSSKPSRARKPQTFNDHMALQQKAKRRETRAQLRELKAQRKGLTGAKAKRLDARIAKLKGSL